jgi:hypothetical protein
MPSRTGLLLFRPGLGPSSAENQSSVFSGEIPPASSGSRTNTTRNSMRDHDKIKPPPCLQMLVARFGTFDLIAAEAWDEFDEGIARWRIEGLAAIGIQPISPQQMKARKRAKRRVAKTTNAQPPDAGRAVQNASAPPKQEHEMDMSKYSGSSCRRKTGAGSAPQGATHDVVIETTAAGG